MRLFLGLVFVLIFSSCTTRIHQMHMQCGGDDMEQTFKSITTLLMREGFEVTHSDLKLGYLKAEMQGGYAYLTGQNTKRVWIFQEDNNKVTAMAIELFMSNGEMGSHDGKLYLNDDFSESYTWYWSIRNGLERMCPGITFTFKDVDRIM